MSVYCAAFFRPPRRLPPLRTRDQAADAGNLGADILSSPSKLSVRRGSNAAQSAFGTGRQQTVGDRFVTASRSGLSPQTGA